MAETVDLKKLKIPELKKELTSRGLAVKGNKQELVDRLAQYLEENVSADHVGKSLKTEEESMKQTGDESILDNGTEPSDAMLTPEGVEEGDLLAQEDEPSLLDDEEEEPAITTKAKIIAPVVLTQPVASPLRTNPAHRLEQYKKIPVVHASAPSTLTVAQRKALRAERFNTPLSEEAKKQARLEKFGGKAAVTTTTAAMPKTQAKVLPVSVETLEKLKKRSERFGTAVSKIVKQTEEMDRLLKRKQRFGENTNTTTAVKRTSTEGSTDDAEAKKKKRAERFGL